MATLFKLMAIAQWGGSAKPPKLQCVSVCSTRGLGDRQTANVVAHCQAEHSLNDCISETRPCGFGVSLQKRRSYHCLKSICTFLKRWIQKVGPFVCFNMLCCWHLLPVLQEECRTITISMETAWKSPWSSAAASIPPLMSFVRNGI